MTQTEEYADLVARWRADEARVRAASAGYGVAAREQLEELSGLDALQRMLDGRLPLPPICETLGFVPIEVEPGRSIYQGDPARAYYNPIGTVHGGWFATLLDSCVACAVHTTIPVGRGFTTVELSVNIVRALTDEVPLVRAEGWTVHTGGKLATAEGRLFGPDGRLYAHATTTCLITELRATEAG